MTKDKPKRVLAFGAHPDDIEIFMLGTLLSLKAAGWHVGWVVATDGSAANGEADAHLADVRKEEALAASQLFDCDVTFLDYPDGRLGLETGAAVAIHAILTQEKPDLILVHHRDDYHPDHRALAHLLTDLRPVNALLLYAEPMLGVGAHPQILVDITSSFEAKLQGLACHISQAPSTDFVRIWNRFRGLQFADKSIQYAESFCLDAYLKSGNVMTNLSRDLNLALL